MTELKTPRLRTFYIKNEDEEQDTIFTLKMARTPEGFQIYCKSVEFHDWMKKLSRGLTMEYNKGWTLNMDAYNISKLWTDRMFDDLQSTINYNKPDDYIPKTLEIALRGWNGHMLLENGNLSADITEEDKWNGTPNISFILSNILDKGFVINFQQPISNRMFNAYYNATQKYLIWINDNFMSSRTKGVKITRKKPKPTFTGKLNLED
tara:strand:- start:2578 stop:3198 length:621 start_codon:yes stop_codon:yes gene_type:complete